MRRQRTGQPIPERVRSLLTYMSTSGHEIGSAAPPLSQNPNLIDAKQTAVILGCSSRHVRRLHTDLEGQLIAGRWLFNHDTVTEYATARRNP